VTACGERVPRTLAGEDGLIAPHSLPVMAAITGGR
jgi:hypothetical protein